MSVTKTISTGTVHLVAHCHVCDFECQMGGDVTQEKASRRIRAHVVKTGHSVSGEKAIGITWIPASKDWLKELEGRNA